MNNENRLKIGFEPETMDKLRKLHKETGAPITELIRRAVDAWLSEKLQTDQPAKSDGEQGGRA